MPVTARAISLSLNALTARSRSSFEPSAIAASSFDSAAIIAIAPSSSPFASIARSASRGVGAAFFSATGSRASSAVTAAFPAVRWSASTAEGPSGTPAGAAGSRSGAVSASLSRAWRSLVPPARLSQIRASPIRRRRYRSW